MTKPLETAEVLGFTTNSVEALKEILSIAESVTMIRKQRYIGYKLQPTNTRDLAMQLTQEGHAECFCNNSLLKWQPHEITV